MPYQSEGHYGLAVAALEDGIVPMILCGLWVLVGECVDLMMKRLRVQWSLSWKAWWSGYIESMKSVPDDMMAAYC